MKIALYALVVAILCFDLYLLNETMKDDARQLMLDNRV